MGMLWLDNDIQTRAQRLFLKLFGSPFAPMLAYSKLLETYIIGGEWNIWIAPAIIMSLFYVISEDFLEFIDEAGDNLNEQLSDE